MYKDNYIHNNYIITTYNYIQTTQNRVLQALKCLEMVMREADRIGVSDEFSREFKRKDRVKSEFSYGKV